MTYTHKGGGVSKWGCHGNGGGQHTFAPPVCAAESGDAGCSGNRVSEVVLVIEALKVVVVVVTVKGQPVCA